MSDSQLDAIHAGIGALLREVAGLGANQSELHVKLDALTRATYRVAADRMKDRFDIDRAHRRIASLEHQVALVSQKPDVPDWRPDPREITGTHDFAVVKAQHDQLLADHRAEEERKRDSGIWRKRQITLWVVAVIGALLSTALAGCVTYAMARLIK